MEELSFSAYLLQKKINEETFSASEKAIFLDWKTLFDQVHPDSFTLQEKFHINTIRRKFPLSKIEN